MFGICLRDLEHDSSNSLRKQSRNATRAESEEGRLFSQAILLILPLTIYADLERFIWKLAEEKWRTLDVHVTRFLHKAVFFKIVHFVLLPVSLTFSMDFTRD